MSKEDIRELEKDNAIYEFDKFKKIYGFKQKRSRRISNEINWCDDSAKVFDWLYFIYKNER